MDAALGLSIRHALHAVRAGLEFQMSVHIAPFDAGDDLLVAAVFTGALTENLHPPALRFGVAGIHAEEIAGEDRRLITARAGAHFQEDVATVLLVAGQQELLQRQLFGLQTRLDAAHFVVRHGADVAVAVLLHLARLLQLILHSLIGGEGLDDRLDLGEFLGERAEAVLIANDFAITQQRFKLFVAVLEIGKFVENGVFHVVGGSSSS